MPLVPKRKRMSCAGCRVVPVQPAYVRIQAYRKLLPPCCRTIVSGVERKGYNAFLDQLPKMEESDE